MATLSTAKTENKAGGTNAKRSESDGATSAAAIMGTNNALLRPSAVRPAAFSRPRGPANVQTDRRRPPQIHPPGCVDSRGAIPHRTGPSPIHPGMGPGLKK